MINYSIIPEEELLVCNLSGNLSLLDINAYVQNLMSDKDFYPGLNALIKVSVGTTVSYTKQADDISNFFSLYLKIRRGAAWAFVAPDKTTSGIIHMVFDEVDISPICVEYFYDEREALMWLNDLRSRKLSQCGT